jgi:glycosyltransferase involved in cell wall biosynthesis
VRSTVEDQELVTVAIPARNEERFIGRCLEAVLAQTYRNMEILVVDGGSSDSTPDIVAEYAVRWPSIKLLSNPRAIVPVSLNLAARAAAGSWFVRIDAHSTVCPDYVERAIAHLRTGRWAGVGGRIDPVGLTPAGRAVAVAMGSRFGIGNAVHHYGRSPVATDHVPFPAYPTALVRDLGGWNESLTVNQDFEFDYRVCQAGHRLLYDPALAITYFGQQSIPGVFRQFRRYGRGKAQVILLHPASAHARHFMAPLLVASLVLGAAVSVRRPALGAAIVAPYLSGLTVSTVAACRHLPDLAARVRLPAAFAAMHLGWGVGFWEGIGRRLRQRRGDSELKPA